MKKPDGQTEPETGQDGTGTSMVTQSRRSASFLLMEGVACSSMRHWKCPCNLLQQPAALQQRHQYFKLMGRLEIGYYCLIHRGKHIHTNTYTQTFLHPPALTQTHWKTQTLNNMSPQAISKCSFIFHSQKSSHHYSLSECKILNYYLQIHYVFMSVCV